MKKIYLKILLMLCCITAYSQQPFQFIGKWGSTGSGEGEFNGAGDLTIDHEGNLLVIDTYNGRVQKFSPDGQFLMPIGRPGTGPGQLDAPSGIALSSQKEIYISNSFSNKITVFNSGGGFAFQWGSEGSGPQQFKGIADIAIDKFDNVYVTDFGNKRVQKFNGQGGYITEWGTFGSDEAKLYSPNSIAVDALGNVYVTDSYRLKKYTSDGAFISSLELWFNPSRIFLDHDGALFISDPSNNLIFRYDANSRVTGWIGNGTGSGDEQFNPIMGIVSDLSGNVYVSDGNNRVQKFKPYSYGIRTASVGCTGNVALKVENYQNPPAGVIGLDVCIKYDPAIMTAKSTYTLGSVVNGGNASWAVANLNISVPGEIKATIYYTSAAPIQAFFNGVGEVITFNFTLKPNVQPGFSPVTSCGIVESNMNNGGFKDYLVKDGGVIIATDPFASKLYYGNTYVPMATPVNNNSYYNLTRIYDATSCEDPNKGAVVSPDSGGNFSLPFSGSFLYFDRDVRGSYSDTLALTPVMESINGNDVVLASNFILGKATPNFYQLIAADVNMDGRVTAGDLTLITRRYLLKIPEYPQVWSYDGYVPKKLAGSIEVLSKDWLFVSDSIVAKFKDFGISNVPSISNCIRPLNICPTYKDKYRGILLGDVDGNWASVNKNQKRISESNEVVLNVDKAAYVGQGVYEIPILISSEDDVSSLDISVDLDSTITVLDIKPYNSNLILDKNIYKRRLLVGAYVQEGFLENDHVYFLRVKVFNNASLNKELFANINAYINGNQVSSRIGLTDIATSIEDKNKIVNFNIYPNPTKGNFSIELKNADDLNMIIVHNILGEEVARFMNVKGDSVNNFDLSGFKPGLYHLKLIGDRVNEIKSLVIE